jgi:hypothetical protein
MTLLQKAAMLALIVSPALAIQSTAQPSHNVPSAQNSGAGIAGQPGGKNGPAANSRGQVASSDQTHSTTHLQDTAKIPGKAGGTSGPAVIRPRSRPGEKP